LTVARATVARRPASPPAGGRRALEGRSADRGAAAVRRQVLDTAARLFREEGYSAVSLRGIAAACGMQAGSLYYHFTSKDEIVSEVLRLGVEHVYRAVREAVEALPRDAPALHVVGVATETHLRVLLELQDYTSANIRIFGQVPVAVRDRHVALRDEYEAFWARLLRRVVPPPTGRGRHLAVVRFFLIGAMNGTLEWYRPDGESIASLARTLTRILLFGLSGPPAGETLGPRRARRTPAATAASRP
jgi:TetR/AcrR family transcriptional regulator, cholesterol catabolism regulator